MAGNVEVVKKKLEIFHHASFPDLAALVNWDAVIDGELLVRPDGEIGSFNDLLEDKLLICLDEAGKDKQLSGSKMYILPLKCFTGALQHPVL